VQDLAKSDEDKAAIRLITAGTLFGRPLAAPPGVPADRIAAIRAAFLATMKDPDFIADAKRQNAEVRPMSGERLAQLYRDLIGAPEEVKSRVKVALEPRKTDTLEVPGGAKTGE
jgi:hypothetical protein